MSNKQQKKAKVVKFLHTAADKTGQFVRKAGPWLGMGIVLLIKVKSDKNSSNKV